MKKFNKYFSEFNIKEGDKIYIESACNSDGVYDIINTVGEVITPWSPSDNTAKVKIGDKTVTVNLITDNYRIIKDATNFDEKSILEEIVNDWTKKIVDANSFDSLKMWVLASPFTLPLTEDQINIVKSSVLYADNILDDKVIKILKLDNEESREAAIRELSSTLIDYSKTDKFSATDAQQISDSSIVDVSSPINSKINIEEPKIIEVKIYQKGGEL